jgi:hypothetical protein
MVIRPSLTPFSLWDVGHNVVHHGYTNLKGFDFVWAPNTRGYGKTSRPGEIADYHVDHLVADVAALRHPNIIQVFEIGSIQSDVGEQNPRPFLSLEYLDGGCLTRFTESPQSPTFAARMVEKLARAAHAVRGQHGRAAAE